jgi:magnesium chelatase family protein
MTLSVIASCALAGLDAPAVRVEVHLAAGLPAFNVVGLADTEVRESRERVRAAIANAGFEFPAGRLIVNLAPADLPKESGRFDLPIAIGVLLASGQIGLPELAPGRRAAAKASSLTRLVMAGELSLTGALVPIAGALAIALAVARRQPDAELIMPAASAAEAARVPDLHVVGAATLAEVVAHLAGTALLPRSIPARVDKAPAPPCLSDVRGQTAACRALEVAAAGGHSLLLIGAPGTGKSMLAQRLPGLLPPLSGHVALEAAALASLSRTSAPPYGARPFRAPHHSTTSVALVGGGSRPRPGEISLAHHGVLFLDELPEFNRQALEALREPLETGKVAIARARHRTEYPARFQLIAAMNPCRCGWHGHATRKCQCTPDQVVAYRNRISGPILDRIDLQVEVPSLGADWVDAAAGPSSADVGARVAAALAIQQKRQGGSNATLDTSATDRHCTTDPAARDLWKESMTRLNWSARSAHRVLRVARTIADLAGTRKISAVHLGEAVQYRRPVGEPR